MRVHCEGGERESIILCFDSTGRHAPLDCRSSTRLPSTALDMEGTLAKAQAVTQLIQIVFERLEDLFHLAGCDLPMVLLRHVGKRVENNGITERLLVHSFSCTSTSITLTDACISVKYSKGLQLKASGSN